MKTEAGWRHPLLFLCLTQAPWYLLERSLYPNLSPVFVATEQQTPLDHLALVASEAKAHGSHRTVTNERFLNQIKLAGHSKRQD